MITPNDIYIQGIRLKLVLLRAELTVLSDKYATDTITLRIAVLKAQINSLSKELVTHRRY